MAAPCDHELRIPVEILARDEQTALVRPAWRAQESCLRCSGGNGCGAHLWFRGSRRDKPLRVPVSICPPNAVSAELTLPVTTLNALCLLVYALPLTAFFLTLIVTAPLAEWRQFVLALLATGATFALSERLAGRALGRQLRLVSCPVRDREKAPGAP